MPASLTALKKGEQVTHLGRITALQASGCLLNDSLQIITYEAQSKSISVWNFGVILLFWGVLSSFFSVWHRSPPPSLQHVTLNLLTSLFTCTAPLPTYDGSSWLGYFFLKTVRYINPYHPCIVYFIYIYLINQPNVSEYNIPVPWMAWEIIILLRLSFWWAKLSKKLQGSSHAQLKLTCDALGSYHVFLLGTLSCYSCQNITYVSGTILNTVFYISLLHWSNMLTLKIRVAMSGIPPTSMNQKNSQWGDTSEWNVIL